MHTPPDLSLASSYVPACLCLFKSVVCFTLFLLAPLRGWIAIVSLLLADRTLWNQHSHISILDVNAVCVALIGGLMVMHARENGIQSLAQVGVIAVWGLLSALQILGAAKLPPAAEVIAAACCVSILSCLFQAKEIGEVMALRSAAFVMANVVLPYLGVLLQNTDVNPHLIVCRTLPILLGRPEVACVWVTTYVFCMGYQVRLSRGKQLQRHDSPEPHINPHPTVCHSGIVSEEASLLREALARKQFRDF